MTNRNYISAIFIAILSTQPILLGMQPKEQANTVYVKQQESLLPTRIGGAVGGALGTLVGWTGMLLSKIMWNHQDGTINNLRRSASTLLLGAAAYEIYAAGKCKTKNDQPAREWMKGLREKSGCIGRAILCGCGGLLMHPGILPYA